MLDRAGNVNPNTKAALSPKLADLLSATVIYALPGQEGVELKQQCLPQFFIASL